MAQVTLSYKTSFDAAHQLPNHPGKCHDIHGHTWTCRFYITGEVNPSTGMLLDFSVLKDAVRFTLQNLDHTLLNKVVPNPTAENLAVMLTKELKAFFSGLEYPLKYFGVELQEGEGGTCDYSEEVFE